MSKLYDKLQEQLATEYKEDAENCIKIYNKLEELEAGKVWEHQWRPMVQVLFIGSHLNSRQVFKPSPIGLIFIKGIEAEQKD